MSTQGAAVGAFTLATMLAAQPFGVSVETIAVGTAFCVMGVFGKAAFEAQRATEGTAGFKWSQILGWLGAGLIGAPFVTTLYLVLLKLVNVQSDSIVILGLLFAGFTGPKAVSWLMSSAGTILSKGTGFFGTSPGGTTPPKGPGT